MSENFNEQQNNINETWRPMNGGGDFSQGPQIDPMYQAGLTGNEKRPKKKEKKPMSMKKKWGVLVAMALVFGLVGGGTMFGVNAAAWHLSGMDDAGKKIASTETTSAESVADAVSSVEGKGAVAEVAQNAMPSLVTISTMSVEEMRSFFGGTYQYEVDGAGTGVIVGENDTELLIATNNHVVEGAQTLSVGFIDETSVEGQIKGTDVNNDLV